MPLSKPERRKHAHRRHISCDGFERADGLWDIEARMTDIKSEPVDNPERGGYVSAGEAFHDISLRVTLDKQLLIHKVEAAIDASPFTMCPAIVGAFKQLEGTRIGSGWLQEAKARVGGAKGCTHLHELLPVIATTGIQAIWPSLREDVMQAGAKMMLNSCHTWAEDSQVIQRYLPQHYKNKTFS